MCLSVQRIYIHDLADGIRSINHYFFLPSEHLAAFRTFLRSEFSEENVEFWLACEDFKSTVSPDDLRWRAEEIYQEFIQPTACREVSLSELMVRGGTKQSWMKTQRT